MGGHGLKYHMQTEGFLSSDVTSRGREVGLLEQIDELFPRGTREHDAPSGFERDFGSVISLGKETSTISRPFVFTRSSQMGQTFIRDLTQS